MKLFIFLKLFEKVKNLCRGSASNHSSVLTIERKCFVWGCNEFGQLGIGNTDNQFTPIETKGLFLFFEIV